MFGLAAGALFSILFGVLILVLPKFLRYFVGVYLIIVGVLALINYL